MDRDPIRGRLHPRSPRWYYSNSPGWTAADWDFLGSTTTGAEVWDLQNNSQVIDDHVGRAVIVSGRLQLMFGLQRLTSTGQVTVEMEGRSYACCSPVQMDIYNPATGCGVTASMSQSWTPTQLNLDLNGCFTLGSNLQAIRIDPTSGTAAITRMRLTFHSATW